MSASGPSDPLVLLCTCIYWVMGATPMTQMPNKVEDFYTPGMKYIGGI